MANTLKKNCLFIDTAESITVDAQKPVIFGIMVTPSANTCRVIIKESASGTTVIDIRIASQESRYISFEAFDGIEVRSTFEVSELTNIDSVVLYGRFQANTNTAR